MRALAAAAGFSVERIVVGFPEEGHELWPAAQGRDPIAFLDVRDGNRLRDVGLAQVRLGRIAGEQTVHAIWGGRRAAIGSAHHLIDAGFEWEQVREMTPEELDGFEEVESLEGWEWPRRDAGRDT